MPAGATSGTVRPSSRCTRRPDAGTGPCRGGWCPIERDRRGTVVAAPQRARRPPPPALPPAGSASSVRPAPTDHGGQREREQPQVQQQRPRGDVLQIHVDPRVEVDVGAPTHLPDTRDAGLHEQALELSLAVRVELLGQAGPWPDETHVSDEDVDELRELVYGESAEQPPHGR